jgi:predicted flap endonuclease-1-like 5' DNA nuclease
MIDTARTARRRRRERSAADAAPSDASGPAAAPPNPATADAYPEDAKDEETASEPAPPDAEPRAEPTGAASDEEDAAAATDASPETDNLAEIQGIGPKMAFRLREAGIRTFGDMASRTADEIRDLMGGLPSFADVDSWIDQAATKARDQG